MITREQLEKALGHDNNPYKTEGRDYNFTAISLLRERIPIEVVPNIICGAGDESIYICEVETALPYLTEEDLVVLADCNVSIDEDSDTLQLFI